MPPKQRRNNNNKKKKKTKAAPAAAIAASCNTTTTTTTINDNYAAASAALTQCPRVNVSPIIASAAAAAAAACGGKCNHGCPPDDGSPEYMAAMQAITFFSEHQEMSSWVAISNNLLDNFPLSFNSTTTKLFAAIAVDCLLYSTEFLTNSAAITTVVNLAALILTIENHDPAFNYRLAADDGIATPAVLKTFEVYVNLDSPRNLVRFFARRIPCDCLDEMKQDFKHEKTGVCDFCRESSNDAALFDCTGCGFVKYCSKECQVKHWVNHKKYCNSIRKSIEAHKKAEKESDKDRDDKDGKPKASEVDKSDSKPTANEL